MSLSQTVKHGSHIFSFKQKHPDCYYIGVTHSFLTENQTQATNQEQENTPSSNALPTFNQDLSYFTPSFILSIDKDYYLSNSQFERQKFQLKIQQAQNQISNSVINLVNPNFNFCQICKESYTAYHDHIKQNKHMKAVSQSAGNKWITDICSVISHRQKQIKKQSKGEQKKTKPQKMTRVKKKDILSSNEQSNQHLTRVSVSSLISL